VFRRHRNGLLRGGIGALAERPPRDSRKQRPNSPSGCRRSIYRLDLLATGHRGQPCFRAEPGALGAAIFVFAEALWQPDKNSRRFRWEPVGWLGQRSYELYLFHIIVLALMRNIVDRGHLEPACKPLWFLVFLVASTAVAAAIARFYSEPLNHRLRIALGGTTSAASARSEAAKSPN
jgi:peptidoglycan/LPS O-acetylase OafA/YrhL